MKKRGLLIFLIVSIILIIFIFTFFVRAEDSESSSEWRMYRQYLNHTAWDGISFTKIHGLNRANFTMTVGGSNIWSSPAVANGFVYMASGAQIYQLNASNVSERIANFSTTGTSYSAPSVLNGFVYVGGGNYVYQLNASNVSQLIASFLTKGSVRTTPAVANGYVYVGSYDNNTYQLNSSNISIHVANFTTGNYVRATPAVANGFIYIGSADNQTYQLNASNISQLIANFSMGPVISSAAVANGYVYTAGYNGKLYQLNASNISEQIANYSGPIYFQSSPAVANGFLYIGTWNGYLYQMNASNISQRIAYFYVGGSVYSSPAVSNGFVYVGSLTSNRTFQLNASNVSIHIANFSTEGFIYSSPAVANSYVYIGSDGAQLYQLNADNISKENDFFSPDINFTFPTPVNNTLQFSTSVYVNVSTYDVSEHSSWIDWNRTLKGWWNFGWINSTNGTIYDNSSYNRHARLINASINATVSGKRGQGLDFDGLTYYVNLGVPLANPSEWTYSVWFYPRSNGTSISALVGQGNSPALRWGGALNRLYLFLAWSESPGYKQLGSPDIALNQWHHAVGVINLSDSSNQSASLYVDGVRVNFASWTTGTITRPSSTHYSNIRDSARSFNGTMDEVMIFSRALSPAEINASYNANLYKLYNNFTNLSDSTYTYKAYAIDYLGDVNATEERTLTIDSVFPDVNFTFPTPANNTFQSSTSVYVNVSTYDANNYSAFIDWNRSLVGWWNFEGVLSNGTVYDNSSYENHGRLAGFTLNTTVSGTRGRALEFDGINDYVIANYNQDFNVTDKITVETWFYHANGLYYNPVVSRDDGTRRSWNIRITTTAEVMSFVVWNQSSSLATATKTFTNSIGYWHHLAAVYNGTSVILYIDGIPGTPANLSGGIKDTNMPLYIGSGAGTYSYWNGSIDEVRIHSRVLSPEEINASYNAGLYKLYNNFTELQDGEYTYKTYAIDVAGNVNTTEERTLTIDSVFPDINFTFPTPANNTLQSSTSVYINVSTYDANNHSAFIDWNRSLVGWWAIDFYNSSGIYDNSTYNNFGFFKGNLSASRITNAKRGKGLEFGGDGDYLAVNEQDFDFTNNFTLEAWIKPTGADSYNAILTKYSSSPVSGWDWILQGGYIRMVARGISSIDTSQQGFDLRDGNWHHIVAVITPSYIQQYIDGIPYTTVAGTWTATTNDVDVAIGYRSGISNFNGTMDEVRIYSRALTLEEVRASYSSSYKLYSNFTNLQDVTYTYKAYVIDVAGNVNVTEENTISINSTIVFNCTNLDVAGKKYVLELDIINNEITSFACINISRQNITLDCQGHLIYSVQNISGIYSAMGNTTVQNCNMNIGGGNKTNTSAVGIYYNYTARNGQILNNTVNATWGIYLNYYANTNSVINNTAYGGATGAGRAIFFNIISNCNLTSNWGITPNGYTILVETALGNNIIKDNTGISTTLIGIRLGASSGNFMINNTGISTLSGGLYLLSGGNNTFINNTGISSSSYGIRIDSSSNNTFINNRGMSNAGAFSGGLLLTSIGTYAIISQNNTFIDNILTSNSSYALALGNTTKNRFYNQTAIGYLAGSQGIYTVLAAKNNTFFDCVNVSGVKWDVNITGNSTGNIFLNCSYNTSKEFVGPNSELIRKWYYSAYVNDSEGNNVTAQINATNVTNDLEFSIDTDSSGMTNMALINDYVNLEGTRTYSSPYNITATNSSYFYNLVSHLFNATNGNNLVDVFTFLPAPVSPSVTPGAGEGGGCEYDWVCSEWYPSPCPSNGIQERVCVNRGECAGTFGMPDLNRTCVPYLIEPAEPLFDIFLNIPSESKWILRGDNVSFDIRLLNVGNKTTIDVSFEYLIIDEDKKVVAERKETRAIGEEDEFEIEFSLPENLKEGTYRVYVQIVYDDGKVATAGDYFEIVKDTYTILLRRAMALLPILLIPFLVILALILLFVLIKRSHELKHLRRHKERKREKREKLVKKKKKKEYAKRYKKEKRKAEREVRRAKEKAKTKRKIRKKKRKIEIFKPSLSLEFIEQRKILESEHRQRKIKELKREIKKRK